MNKTRVILFRSVISLIVNAILSMILVKLYGPWGAVIATVITVYAWAVVYNLYTLSSELKIKWYSFFPFKIWLNTIIFLAVISLPTYFVNYIIQDFYKPFQLTINTITYGVPVIFWLKGKIYLLPKTSRTA
jgi:O-antigen/teichoic acid export membrane protein